MYMCQEAKKDFLESGTVDWNFVILYDFLSIILLHLYYRLRTVLGPCV